MTPGAAAASAGSRRKVAEAAWRCLGLAGIGIALLLVAGERCAARRGLGWEGGGEVQRVAAFTR
jgi:hypothetical protein